MLPVGVVMFAIMHFLEVMADRTTAMSQFWTIAGQRVGCFGAALCAALVSVCFALSGDLQGKRQPPGEFSGDAASAAAVVFWQA